MINQTRQCLLLLALLLVGATSAGAQVTGRVTNGETLAPVSGALVGVQGTNIATVTNADGRYSIAAPATGTIVVSNLGYAQQAVPVNNRAVVDIQLRASALALDEVVAVGYTQQTQRSITGAVASVSPAAIAERKVVTIQDGLRGRIAGVKISQSGDPTASPSVQIRGTAFTTGFQPLYVVDGVYMTQPGPLNPNDIESLQVLKDASAASQFGAQAANGVIIIKTRRGQAGDNNRVRISSSYGSTETPRFIPMMDSQGWARITRMAYENAIGDIATSAAVPGGVLEVENGTNTTNTDWQAVIVQPGYFTDNVLQTSGATPNGNANYFVSGGYTRRQGEILDSWYERFTVRANTELRRGRVTVGENVQLSRANSVDPDATLASGLSMIPGIPVKRADGTYGFGDALYPTFGTNPVGSLERTDAKSMESRAIGSIFGKVNILPGLDYMGTFGFNYGQIMGDNFNRGNAVRQNSGAANPSLSITQDFNQSLQVENTLNYARVIGPHNVNLVLGTTQQKNFRDTLNGSRTGAFSNENALVLSAGTQEINNSQSRQENRLNSYLGRMSYSLNERYLLEGSLRRDGSSRFGPANRWGNFYAGSVGWVASEEAFVRAIPLIGAANFLKLRASYGTLGNQDFGNYEWQSTISTANQGYIFGAGTGAFVPGATMTALTNENVKWQDNSMTNFGLELGLLDNTLSVTAEYYISKSSDLLVSVPLVPSLGSALEPNLNAGSMENTGIEFSMQHSYSKGDLSISSGFNLARVRNKVTSLGFGGRDIISGISRTTVGEPLGMFWGVNMIGIFQDQAEIDAYTALNKATNVVGKIQPNARPGDVKYEDVDGNGVWSSSLDKKILGSPYADAEGGAFIEGSFRNVSFNLGFRGRIGGLVYNSNRTGIENRSDDGNFPTWYEPWTPQNRSNTTPRALFWGTNGDNSQSGNSNRFLESGTYLKVQNVQLAYAIPTGLLGRIGLEMQSARLYANLQNIATFTNYLGWDPEFSGSVLQPGTNGGSYPAPRQLTVGVDLDI